MATTIRKFFYHKTKMHDRDVSFSDMLRKISQLDTQERICMHAGQEVLLDVSRVDDYYRGKVTLLREEGLPTIGAHGTLITRPIDLKDNEGIQEASHFTFLPAKSLLAFEYNHFGPRIGLFFKAINELYERHFSEGGGAPPVADWDYIQRGDALDRINHAQGVKAVEVSYVDGQLSEENGSLGQALQQIRNVGEARTLSVTLKGQKGQRAPIMSPGELFRRFLPNNEHSLPGFDKFKVKILNATGGTEIIDLFEDKLTSEISAIKMGRSKELDSKDLYEKIVSDVRAKANEMV